MIPIFFCNAKTLLGEKMKDAPRELRRKSTTSAMTVMKTLKWGCLVGHSWCFWFVGAVFWFLRCLLEHITFYFEFCVTWTYHKGCFFVADASRLNLDVLWSFWPGGHQFILDFQKFLVILFRSMVAHAQMKCKDWISLWKRQLFLDQFYPN